MAVACDRYQCAGYTVLNSNEQQPDGYEITGSIPNTTISCTFISEDNYMIYYYTARALGNGQLMHEVVPAISSAAVQNLLIDGWSYYWSWLDCSSLWDNNSY